MRRFVAILVFAFLPGCAPPPSAQSLPPPSAADESWRALPPVPPPLPLPTLPRANKRTLRNGIPVYFSRTAALGQVVVGVYIDSGSLSDPAGMNGLASLTIGA